MAESIRETSATVIGKLEGVGIVSLPKNVTYKAFKRPSVMDRIRSVGKKHSLRGYTFPCPEVRDAEEFVYYTDAIAETAEGLVRKQHLEVITKLRKVGKRRVQKEDGSTVMEPVYAKKVKALNADSRWGPLRRPYPILEILNADEQILAEHNFVIKKIGKPIKEE